MFLPTSSGRPARDAYFRSANLVMLLVVVQLLVCGVLQYLTTRSATPQDPTYSQAWLTGLTSVLVAVLVFLGMRTKS